MTSIPFDIVGFDLDGTLLDTHGDLGAAVNHALALAGRGPVPVSGLRDLIGGGGRLMLERALTMTGGIPQEDIAGLFDAFLDHYTANIAVHTRPYAGCEAMLDGLQAAGVRVAVVSNKREDLARQVLDALGMTARFFTVIGGDTLGPDRAKPAPDQLHEMIARGGGGRAAYVGDTTYDTRAALAAGMPCIAVSFGFNDRAAHALGASAVIDHFDALIPALRAL